MYTFDNPRLTCELPLAAGDRFSLTEFIKTKLAVAAAIEALFVNATVANQAARLAVGREPGYVVYQTDTGLTYLILENNGASLTDWQTLDLDNTPAYRDFINNLSWKIKIDSSLGNQGAGDLVVINNFKEATAPSVTAFGTYGVPITAATERTCSGHAGNIYLYSAAGTGVLLDLVFEVG